MTEDFSRYNGKGTMLHKAQMRMLDILVEIDKICKKHHIEYWLQAGTVIGAVCWGGFIPWDDDLDIALMRKDYKRLRKILKKELPDNMVFQDETTEKYYPLKFAKVRDKKSVIYDYDYNPKVKEQGLYVDIFPMERGSVKIKRIVEFFYGRAFRRLRHMGTKTEYFIACLMWIPSVLLMQTARTLSFLTNKDSLIDTYGNSCYHKYSKKHILPTKPILFEGREFNGPANPDAYLRDKYGRYEKYIPVEERGAHSTGIEIYE